MNVLARAKRMTFDDFCALVRDGEKADLIDGVIHTASPENTDANDLFMWLGALIKLFVEERDLGKVYGWRVAFRLDEGNGPEPDLAFVRASRLGLVKRGRGDGPPDLAVEIVSPESVDRDYTGKRLQYQRAGVREYWIVDELKQEVTLLRLGPRGRYRRVKPRQGVLRSEVMAGFWLRPEWLWQEPRRKVTAVLAELLA